MFSKIPEKSESSNSNNQKYAHVTKAISRHEAGQVQFLGRYYQAELNDPNDVDLPVGVWVKVYAEREGSMLVGLDTSFLPPPLPDTTVNESTYLGRIPVFYPALKVSPE